MSYLICIRGNSGSGKSTLAREVRQALVNQGEKVALLEQDTIRRQVLKEKDIPQGANIDLIEEIATFCFSRGYAVVLEGILHPPHYEAMVHRLCARVDHSHLYYLDVSFEETLRRHQTKTNAHEFGEAQMREWWVPHNIMKTMAETVLPESMSLDEARAHIVSQVVTPQTP